MILIERCCIEAPIVGKWFQTLAFRLLNWGKVEYENYSLFRYRAWPVTRLPRFAPAARTSAEFRVDSAKIIFDTDDLKFPEGGQSVPEAAMFSDADPSSRKSWSPFPWRARTTCIIAAGLWPDRKCANIAAT